MARKRFTPEQIITMLAYFGLMVLKRKTKENDDSYGENEGNHKSASQDFVRIS
jgi:hypothetical protein